MNSYWEEPEYPECSLCGEPLDDDGDCTNGECEGRTVIDLTDADWKRDFREDR